MLAVATHVARRDGLPEPVPITRVFPQVSESDENEWQEAVVRHLGLADWQRVVIEDELDVIGPIATQHLARPRRRLAGIDRERPAGGRRGRRAAR